ncbi:MAG TPA: hypothetical protein PKE69_00100 [Pyrinomonadaceae bacterium]|nr:hypothetical protein [Pyrinomonadaceae bacterium]
MNIEKTNGEVFELIENFLEVPPTEENLMSYLDEDCDALTAARIEAHFRRNPQIRLQINEMKQWLDKLEDTETTTENAPQKAADVVGSLVAEAKNIFEELVGAIIFYRYSTNRDFGFGAPDENQIDFNFSLTNGQKCYGYSAEIEGSLKIQIFFTDPNLEGALITLEAENDFYTKILFKRNDNFGTTFIIPENKRKISAPAAKLKISRIILTEQITRTDIDKIEDELKKMRNGSENQKAAAEKITNHLNKSNA